MTASKDIEIEVLRVHSLFWESYARRDIELRFSICSDDITFIGSGLHERAINKTEYKKINQEGVKQFPNHFQIEFLWTTLTMINENVACVESEVMWSQLINNETTKELLRNTTLLKYDNDKWLVTHVHGSVPDYRLKDGDYMTNEQTIIRNKELERQVFERTRDLNKTLEELEQKNRALEVEAALEKVRAVAMGMNKPDDMLGVCKTISQQLESLGVKEIRNVQTAIFYEQRGTYMNYEFYAKHDKTFITETVFTNHTIHNEFAMKMLRGKGEVFITHITGDEVKDWIAYQKTTNVFIDKYLETTSSLNYYWFSLGIVALGISTYIPLSEEEIKLFKRFLRVFELAYQMYLDIEKAEAQAREAQIETALERVRSRTMGMQKSDELKEVIQIVYDQLVQLKIHTEHTGFIMDYKTRDDFNSWIADRFGTPSKITIPYFDCIYYNRFNEAKEKGKDFFAVTLSFEEKNKFYTDLFQRLPGFPEESKKTIFDAPAFAISTVLLENVALYIENFAGVPYSDEENKILMRFGKVFQQTYTRFLDLQKAEAQTREAKIEAALERTRTQSMLMQHSDELNDISKIFHEQLLLLGIDSEFSFVWLPNEEKDEHLFWATWANDVDGAQQFQSKAINYPMDKTEPYTAACFAAWESDEPVHEYYVQPVEIENFFKSWEELLKGAEQFKAELFPEGIYYTEVYMKYGCFGIDIRRKLTLDEKEIIRRFAVEFERTYTRFLDLKKAEAQAREAQIEAALERIRSAAMAMRDSSALSELIYKLYGELTKLDAKLDRCFIMIVNSENHGITWWLAGKEGLLAENGFFIQMNQHPSHLMYLECWEKRKKKWQYLFEGKEKRDWDSFGFGNTELARLPEFIKKDMAGVQKIHLSGSSDQFGSLVTGSLEPLPEEQQDIISRFTIAFNQAFIRFLDLQKAEEQGREAIKQASLDRVRGEIASMRTSEDLNRITPIIWRELKTLEVPFIRCGVFMVNEVQEKVHVYLTTPDGKSLGVLHLSFDANELTNSTVDYWKKKQVYKEHWNKEQFINWTNSLIEIGQVQNAETYQGSATPPASLHLHFVPFSQGMLYVGDVNPLTEEKLDLVKTLAEAFSIAYSRYEDFQNLEEAKNKIELTLKELKAAQVQLIHSEKMASLGELTAGIAHEIKNPLNFVNNFSEVSRELLDEMKVELEKNNLNEVIEIVEDLKQNLEKINQHGKRADSIVKGMLLHSRGTSGEKTLTDMNDLLDQYVNLAYHGMRAQNKEFNITIEKDYDQSIEKINVIPQDLSRVFLNIINNACYAAYDKKQKSGDNNFSPTLKVSTKNLDGNVEIRIGDNGNGIPKDILDKIFQPFFTTKPTGEGTGLGLSLSYDIITKMHGGELKVESEESKYTEFIISLPKV